MEETTLPDGGSRIQCVEVEGKELLLLISVCMPCKGIADNSVDFADVVVQLSVILTRYSATHEALIDGDMNEDLTTCVTGTREQYLREFISEHKLQMQLIKPTFVNAKVVEVSTINCSL